MTSTAPAVRTARTYSPKGDVGRHLVAARDLQQQIQELEAKLARHRVWLLTHMNRLNLDRLEEGDFLAVRKLRHAWDYSPETEREALALRALQKWEQAQGIATDSPTLYLSLQHSPKKA